MRAALLAASLLASAPAALAGTIQVPADQPTLALAIQAAAAGDVIVVAGGSHPPITIDKPLTIIGAPQATIFNTVAVGPAVPPAITLAGPGGGAVRLENVKTLGAANGLVFATAGSGIAGGGFDALEVHDSSIAPSTWFNLTGIGIGAPAIDVSVPLVTIARSFVEGGQTQTDACDYAGVPDGAVGVRAQSATVVVLDSIVRGGRGPDLCFSPGLCPGNCPCPFLGGLGGTGVEALRVLRSNSTIEGGAGQLVQCGDQPTGTQPDGADVLTAEEIDLGHELMAPTPLVTGANFTLYWFTTGSPALLAFSTPDAPQLVPGAGWLFATAATLFTTPVPGGTGALNAQVPADPNLVGVPLAVQVYDPLTDLTNPFIGVIRP